MIKNINDYLHRWTDFVIANPAASRGESVGNLQLVSNGIRNAEGNAWFDVLAVLLDSIGSINNPTYSSLRNDVVAEGEIISKSLFDTLHVPIRDLPESVVISTGLLDFERRRRLLEINDDIAYNILYRNALPTPPAITTNAEERTIRRALNDGIRDLRQEKQEIRGRLGE